MRRTIAPVVCAVLLAAFPAGKAEAVGGSDCVSKQEWYHLNDLGTAQHSPTRAVLQETWDVKPTNYRNRYWVPANNRLYSLSYNFCANDKFKIVMVYRKKTGAWQMAIKGRFI